MKFGMLIFQAELFWTTQHSFGKEPRVTPQLLESFASGDLVVYKGSLSYRKLTNDGLWPPSRKINEALGPLARQRNVEGLGTLVLEMVYRAFKGVRG